MKRKSIVSVKMECYGLSQILYCQVGFVTEQLVQLVQSHCAIYTAELVLHALTPS